MRTCVMCKKKVDKRQLFRIVRTPEGEVVFDPTGKKNGRGAYICADDACVNSIKSVKKIAAALEIEADAAQLEKVYAEIKEYITNMRM
jgi:predicted RNA-binding protein YlxR (DUF448 family)